MIRIALTVVITTLAAAVTFFLNAIWAEDWRWAATGVVTVVVLIIELVIAGIFIDDWDRR